jgi:hypothetical protein
LGEERHIVARIRINTENIAKEERIEGIIINAVESKDGYKVKRDKAEGELRDGT